LRTTSVASPTRSKTPTSSNTGLTTSPYPPRPTRSANSAIRRSQRADSGGRTSRVPTGAWNSGTRPRLLGGVARIVEVGGKAAHTGDLPTEGVVFDAKARSHLLTRVVEPGDATCDRLVGGHVLDSSHRHPVVDVDRLPASDVVEPDVRPVHGVHLTDGRREVLACRAPGPTEEDVGQGRVLAVVRALVHVQ